MKKKNNFFYKTIILILVLILFVMMFNFLKQQRSRSFQNLNDREKVSIIFNEPNKMINLSNETLLVEVVNSVETTKQGLSDRDEIGSDGMLFIFPDRAIRSFWMLRMKFNLDMVWIEGDKVVGFSKDVQKPAIGVKNNDLELISINKKTDKVLELNAGDVEKYKIKVGDAIRLK